MTDDGVSG